MSGSYTRNFYAKYFLAQETCPYNTFTPVNGELLLSQMKGLLQSNFYSWSHAILFPYFRNNHSLMDHFPLLSQWLIVINSASHVKICKSLIPNIILNSDEEMKFRICKPK